MIRMRVMRIVTSAATVLAAYILASCAQVAVQETASNFATCVSEVRSSPEGQMVFARLWANDNTDTAAKLNDPKPLTKEEQNAYVQVHNKARRCKQIVIDHDNRYAAWETPYWQELFQRGDAIFSKLASGEISVGLANKLAIESMGKFQVDVSKGHADAVRVEEAQRQRAAEAMLQASAQMLASQPTPQMTMTTTNCSWVLNTLRCRSMSQ